MPRPWWTPWRGRRWPVPSSLAFGAACSTCPLTSTLRFSRLGEAASTRGKVVALGLKRFRGGSKSVFELILDDGTGRLHCRWWNLPFMQNYFAQGDDVLAYGAVHSLKPRTIDHPEAEVVVSGKTVRRSPPAWWAAFVLSGDWR